MSIIITEMGRKTPLNLNSTAMDSLFWAEKGVWRIISEARRFAFLIQLDKMIINWFFPRLIKEPTMMLVVIRVVLRGLRQRLIFFFFLNLLIKIFLSLFFTFWNFSSSSLSVDWLKILHFHIHISLTLSFLSNFKDHSGIWMKRSLSYHLLKFHPIILLLRSTCPAQPYCLELETLREMTANVTLHFSFLTLSLSSIFFFF